MSNPLIRNFAIIAHIDHGKSTLADRFLELTHTVERGRHEEQLLDRNPISRERGITIKLAPVRMHYKGYTLHLIDTPGHVDFSYEVDRTLACVEGVILLVDATQGIQAQTIANAYKAIEKNLIIIPAVNKIDMPAADFEKVMKEIVDFLGIEEDTVFGISAKTGTNVPELLDAVLERIPAPQQPETAPADALPDGSQPEEFQALIFDSYYDQHKGVIAFTRIFRGTFESGMKMQLASNGMTFEATEVGIFDPELREIDALKEGEIGYIVTNLKDIHQVRVGDTIVDGKGRSKAVSGYKKVKPIVYASMFTTDTADYLNLKKALDKLYLNDSSLEFTAIYSQALGAGFRVGFLGLLHADVVRERLEREFGLSLVLTPPQVDYEFRNGQYYEPIVKIMIVAPSDHIGSILSLCEEYRAKFVTMDNKNQVTMHYVMPMSEMISDFFDRLKSVTSGYASLDWEFLRYEPVTADKLSLLLNGEEVEEFSEIVVQDRAFEKAQELTKKLKELIPRQQFDIKIQAKFRGKIIASESLSAYRKDVLVKNSKVVGAGDVGRKKKLLEKQKEGKKRMKMIGRVEVPKEAFLSLFNRNRK
ncbi:MAG: translation elongation factor 4 [Patescibacteria group bacterium]|nr:translation elongation factor 4 [Patescibacteria group bacterium]